MSGGRVVEGRDAWLDLAGLVLMVAVAVVLVFLALLGYSVGLAVWPFAVGAVAGDVLMYLAIKNERFRMPILVFASLLVVFGFAAFLELAAGFGEVSFQLPWDTPLVVSQLAIGVLFGFGGMVLTEFMGPTLYSPDTWDEAVVRRRESVRDVLIVGGALLGIVLLVLLLLAFAALAVLVAVNFG